MTKLTQQELDQFTGMEGITRSACNPRVFYTDGVRYMAERTGEFWIIDAIANWVASADYLHASAYDERLCYDIFWNLSVQHDKSAVLKATADDQEYVEYTLTVPSTNFPLSSVDLWLSTDVHGWTLYLAKEYLTTPRIVERKVNVPTKHIAMRKSFTSNEHCNWQSDLTARLSPGLQSDIAAKQELIAEAGSIEAMSLFIPQDFFDEATLEKLCEQSYFDRANIKVTEHDFMFTLQSKRERGCYAEYEIVD